MKKMTIVMGQKGGFGNQLFQYAAGTYYAEKYRAHLEIVPTTDLRHLVSFGEQRPFLLSEFQVEAKLRARNLTDKIKTSPLPLAAPLTVTARRFTRTIQVEDTANDVEQTCWDFFPELPVTPSTRTVYLQGYFQVYEYAAAVEPQLRRQFVLRSQPQGKNLEVLHQIQQTPAAVSVHLRGGDYKKFYNGKHLLTPTYYRNAMERIKAQVPNPTYFVFSNDEEFARETIPDSGNVVFVNHNDDSTSHHDMLLMAACRHNIIANSSFSWWGAWLNPNPGRIVCAPHPWMDPKNSYDSLLPPDWLRVPTT